MEVESFSEEEERRLTQLRFDAAVKVIKSLPADGPFQPSNDMMLKFYSYYKQATLGLCNTPRPGFWDVIGKAKWDAWNSLGDMSKEAAMAAYVDEMKLILEGMPMTHEVEELLRVIGPFYELVEERKKISQISDLSTGFSSTLNSVPSKSVAKSIVRNMELNGTLETPPAQVTLTEGPAGEEAEEDEGDEEENEDDDEDEDETTEKETRKALPAKKKSSSRRQKAPLTNGAVTNGAVHLTNGNQCGENSEDDHLQPNGPLRDLSGDAAGANHLLSDSDSEVYCDSVDQFGQETSEHNRSLDDMEEERLLLPHDDSQDDGQEPPQGVQCGGEEGEAGGMSTQRHTNTETAGGSSNRRGRGSRSPGNAARPPLLVQGGGDGDGRHWGGASTPAESLNEQIVVALARLQEDMQSVLERLHTLEALTASQARSAALSPSYVLPPVTKKTLKPSWWPFDISPSSLAFAVVWPFVVQWLIRLYLHRRRRRAR